MGKYFLCLSSIIILFIISSCKNRNLNYITYYNQVNNIDSIYRFKKDIQTTVKQYKKLFRQYLPLNQNRIEEYETYIRLSDQQNKNFGGKKSLRKLIFLIAPYWQYKKKDSTLMHLFQKNGITPKEIEQDIAEWKNKNNRKLIDSFSVAFQRDQDSRKNNLDIIKNDKKNAEMLKWMFENEGFPSIQKIGLWNNNLFIPVGPLLLHMADYDEYHQYFKTKILEYVKSGECPPRDYAAMIDRYYLYVLKKDPPYYIYVGHSSVKDSTAINRNRKSIGLPSIKHGYAIIKDYNKKNKAEK